MSEFLKHLIEWLPTRPEDGPKVGYVGWNYPWWTTYSYVVLPHGTDVTPLIDRK